MDYMELLKIELKNIEDILKTFPDNYTIKSIKGKFYLYEQSYKDGKIICISKGIASNEHIQLYKMKSTHKLILWICKNNVNFIEGLKLLAIIKNKPYAQSITPQS